MPATQRVILLVEDNAADAALVSDYLAPDRGDSYTVHHASLLEEGFQILTSLDVDTVLLDLYLPDSVGMEGVAAIRQKVGDVPIVVLTGLSDEALAIECIDAGAQDYLFKDDLNPTVLKRAIEYALARRREAEVRELRHTLSRYRWLASGNSVTSVTARNAGVGPMRESLPAEYQNFVNSYTRLMRTYVDTGGDAPSRVRSAMQILVTRIGDGGGGPKDLIDMHTEALDAYGKAADPHRHQGVIVEGRLFALEMMGLLVEYYRVGRRYYFDGASA